ncbi:MAG: 7TM diverse intracellular signaling domain-containing protein [Bacteroidota bacterium]
MHIHILKRLVFIVLMLVLPAKTLLAQQVLAVDSGTFEHLFGQKEIKLLEDKKGTFTLQQVMSAQYERQFKDNPGYYPQNYNLKSWYWFKVKMKFDGTIKNKNCLIEFFDQTTDDITAYIPDTTGRYVATKAGAKYHFTDRLYRHKNFEFTILNRAQGEYTYYFRVKSLEQVNVIIVYRTVDYFIHYALTEYMTYGLFYGMILIFCFHNLLMFIAVKRLQYLFYVLYILSVGFYEMSVDGIAFQYLWPTWPTWNEYAYGVALFFLSAFALEFTKELLQVKTRARGLYKLINFVLVVRTIYFIYCLFFNKGLFIYKFVDSITLAIAFFTGIKVWSQGFKPARFFVLGYTFLFLGFMLKLATVLGLNFGIVNRVLGHYSLSLSFVLEMVFLSFSIGDQVRLLRKDKDAAQEETIKQMAINVDLKDTINRELEQQVQIRTFEVIQKSDELVKQSHIIEEQNEELLAKNDQLEKQADEIYRMNLLLEKDNIQLKTNIEKVTDARALSTELSFEEFSAKYPDQETCYKFLSELKWSNGYECSRCANTVYCGGRMPYSRRCTKCTYEESALQKTIFHNNRIPINKAFYLVYLMYTSKGTISSHQLSEKLDIRQSTCWSYSIRVKKAMSERKKETKKGSTQGWSRLVIEVQ